MPDFNSLDSKHYILIKGAGMHNLKKIDVAIPRNNFVVITGLSGSGKSSIINVLFRLYDIDEGNIIVN